MSQLNLNSVTIAGRIAYMGEYKKTSGGKSVIRIAVAINKRIKGSKNESATFVPVVAWEGTADIIDAYFHKGSSIMVEGYLTTNTYQPADYNKKVTELVVTAVKVHFLDNKKAEESVPEQSDPVQETPPYNPYEDEIFV